MFRLKISQREYSDSYFTVKGSNNKWVNGLTKQVEEIIESFTPQNNFVKNNKTFLNILFGLGLGAIYLYLISRNHQ